MEILIGAAVLLYLMLIIIKMMVDMLIMIDDLENVLLQKEPLDKKL